MVAGIDFFLVGIGSVLHSLFPLFDGLLFAFVSFNKLLLPLSNLFFVVNFIGFQFVLKLGLEESFSGFVSLSINFTNVFFDLSDLVTVFIELLMHVSSLVLHIVLLLSDVVEVVLDRLDFIFKLVLLLSESVPFLLKLVHFGLDFQDLLGRGKGFLQYFDLGKSLLLLIIIEASVLVAVVEFSQAFLDFLGLLVVLVQVLLEGLALVL